MTPGLENFVHACAVQRQPFTASIAFTAGERVSALGVDICLDAPSP